jgi:cyclophilin family peptidyl-prolyl cis-trans isomerase
MKGFRMGFSVGNRIAVSLAVATLLIATAPLAMGAGETAVHLELSQQFYYEDDALDVRIAVHNNTKKKIDNPIQTSLFEGFKVRRNDKAIERSGETSAEEPTRPAKLASESFYGAMVNLVDLYPELARAGTYEIYWAADKLVSNVLVVTVIPRFDPTKDYLGEIQTDRGVIRVDLYGKESPIAVKSFIDLANAGFYTDHQISEIRMDQFIVGGDPRFARSPRPSIQYPAEQSALPLVAGAVVMRPLRATPPANGSTFAILLRPQPSWAGQVTVLGQVVEGLDLVQRLSRMPSSMRNSQPNFKPLQEIVIQKVTVREKPATGGGS